MLELFGLRMAMCFVKKRQSYQRVIVKSQLLRLIRNIDFLGAFLLKERKVKISLFLLVSEI